MDKYLDVIRKTLQLSETILEGLTYIQANLDLGEFEKTKTMFTDVIEGIYVRGQSCLIIDDLITGGGSILQTAATLSEAGLVVRDAVTLIDRQEGGRQALQNAGINLVAILTLEQIANYRMSAGHIQEDQYRRTVEYIAARG